MALGEFHKLVAAAVKDCKAAEELAQLRAFLLRECAAECEKTVAYYQSRKAKLKKEYNKSCAELEREYKDAVDELNRSLGVSTPASREPEHTAQEDTGAGNADEGEELTQNEKFLKKAGYSETGAKGEITLNEKTMKKLTKTHKKFLQPSACKDSLKQGYEDAGMNEQEVKLAIDMHKYLSMWHMGSKTIPAMCTLPREFYNALSRDRSAPFEGRPNPKGLLYRDYLVLSQCEKLRQYVCLSSALLQNKDEVVQAVTRMIQFVSKEVKSFRSKVRTKAAFKGKSRIQMYPTNVSLLTIRGNRPCYSMGFLKKEAGFSDFLKNRFREHRPRYLRSSTSLKRKRDDKDQAYFGLSTVNQVKQKKVKLVAAATSDFEDRSCYVMNEIMRAKQLRVDQERIIKRATGAMSREEMRANWQAPWVADLDQLIVEL